MLAKYLGCQQAVGVTSCTGAMQLSLEALGIGQGDEVITTPLSFVATAHAILQAGAQPVFVDVEPATYNLNPKEIAKHITKKTRAIIPVHVLGLPANMPAIIKLAKKYNRKSIFFRQ